MGDPGEKEERLDAASSDAGSFDQDVLDRVSAITPFWAVPLCQELLGLSPKMSGEGRRLGLRGYEPGGRPGLPLIKGRGGLAAELSNDWSAWFSMRSPIPMIPKLSSEARGVGSSDLSSDTCGLGVRPGTRVDVEMEGCSVVIDEEGSRSLVFS